MCKRLLIIGAGIEQVEAYKIAKSMNLLVVGTDMNPKAPAFKFADDHLIASTRDVSETLEAVIKYNLQKPINGVITVANDVPFTVASVASKLELPGISIDSAKIASNKLLMKERFTKKHIPTPRFFPLKVKSDLFKYIKKIGYPAILKPSDGRGSRGVLFLDKAIDLSWAWDNSIKHSESGILMLEEFAKGPQLSVEGIFNKKRYIPIAFADRNYDNLNKTKPHIIEDGGIIPSRFKTKVLDRISKLIEQASFSLDISWGTVKADIVLTKDGLQILELAARLSGNYLATHHIPMAYGVDIISALIKLSLDEEIKNSDLVAKHKKYLGVRYFFPPPGKIKEIKGADKVKDLSYVRMLELYKKPNDYQEDITHHATRAGTVICEGSNYSLAKKRVDKIVNRIKFCMNE